MTPEFRAWPKIKRDPVWMRVTEKIDGTNGCIVVTAHGVFAQSRKRLITPQQDNFGFAAWVQANEEALYALGPGYHYGEWYGLGIQRGYGLDHRRFALFGHWHELSSALTLEVPELELIPEQYRGEIEPLAEGIPEPFKSWRGDCLAEGIVVEYISGRLILRQKIITDAPEDKRDSRG